MHTLTSAPFICAHVNGRKSRAPDALNNTSALNYTTYDLEHSAAISRLISTPSILDDVAKADVLVETCCTY